jgi:hypothetical protein
MSNEICASASCDCGRLSIEVLSAPFLQLVCHCADCRKVTGQPSTEIAFYAPGTYIVHGECQPLTMKGGSGYNKTYSSCLECGAPVYATVDVLGGAVGVIANRLSPFRFMPLMHVWTSKKATGTRLPALALKFSKGPPTIGASVLRRYVNHLAKARGPKSA